MWMWEENPEGAETLGFTELFLVLKEAKELVVVWGKLGTSYSSL